jgi:hypothetical protein
VLSNQLYNIRRSPTGICNIADAQKWGNTCLFDYLTSVIQKGTIVVIRIYPSPGNFTDWTSPGQTHTLLNGTAPAGGTYCGDPIPNDDKPSAPYYYRAVNDITAEMNAIYNLNIANGWPATQFYFEPANEPNKEWYADQGDVNPNIDNQTAWQAMDAYFSALYDNAKSLNANLKVLTPSMAQGANAEKWSFRSCDLTGLIVNGVTTASAGYDWMQLTYTTKNDGYSWHNYWTQTKEYWQGNFCQGSSPPPPTSHHLFQYFPEWLQTEIASSNKPAFITEADLLSPCLDSTNFVSNKDSQASAAQESIWRFTEQEQGADYIAVWLLTNQFGDPPPVGQQLNCTDANAEIAWHEAYKDSVTYERQWFSLWWLRAEP